MGSIGASLGVLALEVHAAEALEAVLGGIEMHGRATLGAVEAGRGSFPRGVVRDELVEAFFASVFLVFGVRVAAEFPEIPPSATRAFESRG